MISLEDSSSISTQDVKLLHNLIYYECREFKVWIQTMETSLWHSTGEQT